jgi:hypothetical protein
LFNFIIGCNMAFVRAVFEEIGMFDTDFGAGSRLASSEDIDFLYRAYKKGLKVVGYAIGHGAFYCKYMLMADKDVFHLARSEVSSLIKQILTRSVKRQSSAHQRLFLTSIVVGFMYRLIKI